MILAKNIELIRKAFCKSMEPGYRDRAPKSMNENGNGKMYLKMNEYAEKSTFL